MLLTLENPYFVKTKISIKTLFPPDKKDFNSTYEEPLQYYNNYWRPFQQF